MRTRHGDLDRLSRKGGDCIELVNQPEVGIFRDAILASGGGVKNIGVMLRDRLRPRAALECWNLLPKMVEHCVRRRVAVVSAPMHFSSRDHVNSRKLLVEYRGLACPELSVRHGRH